LIDELEIDLRVVGPKVFSFIGINNKNKPAEYQNKIHRGWLDLYHSAETRDLAIDLARYSFTQSGFQPNLNQFYTYIPQEIMTDLGMNRDVNEMFGFLKRNVSDPNLLDQIARHNSDNPSIVPTVFNLPKGMSIADMNAGFSVDRSVIEEMVGERKADTMYLSVSIGDKVYLFKKHWSSDEDNQNFLRVSKLGQTSGKNKISEYAMGQEIESSVLDVNNFSPTLQGQIEEKLNSFQSSNDLNVEAIESSEESSQIVNEMEDAQAYSLKSSAFFDHAAADVTPDGDYIDESKIMSMEELLSKLPQLKKDGDITDKGCE
jgi:hypothetical protein